VDLTIGFSGSLPFAINGVDQIECRAAALIAIIKWRERERESGRDDGQLRCSAFVLAALSPGKEYISLAPHYLCLFCINAMAQRDKSAAIRFISLIHRSACALSAAEIWFN
jgi:hypothetical protein